MHARPQTSMNQDVKATLLIEDLAWTCYNAFDEHAVDSADPVKFSEFLRTQLNCPNSVQQIVDRMAVLRGYRAQLKRLREIPILLNVHKSGMTYASNVSRQVTPRKLLEKASLALEINLFKRRSTKVSGYQTIFPNTFPR